MFSVLVIFFEENPKNIREDFAIHVSYNQQRKLIQEDNDKMENAG